MVESLLRPIEVRHLVGPVLELAVGHDPPLVAMMMSRSSARVLRYSPTYMAPS